MKIFSSTILKTWAKKITSLSPPPRKKSHYNSSLILPHLYTQKVLSTILIHFKIFPTASSTMNRTNSLSTRWMSNRSHLKSVFSNLIQNSSPFPMLLILVKILWHSIKRVTRGWRTGPKTNQLTWLFIRQTTKIKRAPTLRTFQGVNRQNFIANQRTRKWKGHYPFHAKRKRQQ